jgi:hypothetical protein
MIDSLSRYAQAIQTKLSGEERTVELALILDTAETALPGRSSRDWSHADALHELLVQCIVRRKGQAEFSDEVADMLAAVQAYELAGGDFLAPRSTKPRG